MRLKRLEEIKIWFIIILFFIPSPIYAGTFRVKIQVKPAFNYGERVYFNYSIHSNQTPPQQINYLIGVNCPDAPSPSTEGKELWLKKGKEYSDKYSFVEVYKGLEPQTCKAYVQIYSPITLKKEKKFAINTKPSFYYKIETCKDKQCSNKSTLFYLEEKVFIKYKTNLSNITVNMNLTIPNKTVIENRLPYNFTMKQTGDYTIKTRAMKNGYRPINKKTMFSVIKRKPNISLKKICNANNICEPDQGETQQNCPTDCPSPETEVIEPEERPSTKKPPKPLPDWIYYVGSVVALIAILIIIYLITAWRKKERILKHVKAEKNKSETRFK